MYLSARTGVLAATVWRILQRNGLNRLSWIDRPTGRVIRRYERSSPGELVQLDVKKVGQIPPGGGWRIHGRNSAQARRSKRRPVGYTYLHVAIDDYSRVAYVEAHDDETAKTLVGFWRRAQGWFWSNDMPVDEVLTGAPGSWRWSVKRRRGTRLETVATSDRAYPRHQDAPQAAEAFVSAEKTWDRAGRSDND